MGHRVVCWAAGIADPRSVANSRAVALPDHHFGWTDHRLGDRRAHPVRDLGSEATSPGTSCLLGAVAGFVVGLAYLVPQWVGAHGFLEATARPIQATDKIQFEWAVLVAISAGVGFDTVFTRLKREAAQVPVTVSR